MVDLPEDFVAARRLYLDTTPRRPIYFVSAEERMAYLKRANAVRRGDGDAEEGQADHADAEEAAASTIELGEQRYVEMSAAEQFILTVSERGHGKRSSSYEYRITNRGGKGVKLLTLAPGDKLLSIARVIESDEEQAATATEANAPAE